MRQMRRIPPLWHVPVYLEGFFGSGAAASTLCCMVCVCVWVSLRSAIAPWIGRVKKGWPVRYGARGGAPNARRWMTPGVLYRVSGLSGYYYY